MQYGFLNLSLHPLFTHNYHNDEENKFVYIVNCVLVHVGATGGVTPSPKKLAAAVKREGASPVKSLTTVAASSSSSMATDGPSSRDDLFRQFRHICAQLEKEPSYNAKTKIVSNFIKFGSSGGEREGGRERERGREGGRVRERC